MSKNKGILERNISSSPRVGISLEPLTDMADHGRTYSEIFRSFLSAVRLGVVEREGKEEPCALFSFRFSIERGDGRDRAFALYAAIQYYFALFSVARIRNPHFIMTTPAVHEVISAFTGAVAVFPERDSGFELLDIVALGERKKGRQHQQVSRQKMRV